MIALGVVVGLLVCVVYFLLLAAHRANRAQQGMHDAHRKEVERLNERMWERATAARTEEHQRSEQLLAEIRSTHRQATETLREEHARMTEAREHAFAATMESMMNVATFGSKAKPAEAVRVNPEADAESRLRRDIQEETIEHGARQLLAEYTKQNIVVTLDDCRQEAKSMLLGIGPREAGLPDAAEALDHVLMVRD